MTERNVSGDVARSKFKAAQKLAGELGLTADQMDAIADGVREFDAQGATDVRQARALERIERHLSPRRGGEDGWEFEERRLRRREVYAAELMAVALFEDDPSAEAMSGVRGSDAYKRLVSRLTRTPGSTLSVDAAP
jgi:hypothetical protein